MDKLGSPRGLIRMASERQLSGPGALPLNLLQHLARRRVVVYGGLLTVAIFALVSAFSERATLRVNVMRDRSVIARQMENGAIENVYRLQVLNALEIARDLRVDVRGPGGLQLASAAQTHIEPVGAQTLAVTLRLEAAQAQALAGQVLPITLGVSESQGNSPARAEARSTFLVPR